MLGWNRLLRSLELLVRGSMSNVWLTDSVMRKLRRGVLLKHMRLLILKTILDRLIMDHKNGMTRRGWNGKLMPSRLHS